MPKRTKIQYAPLALSDLEEIRDYISVALSNPVAAERTIRGILERIERLERHPELGPCVPPSVGLGDEYRIVMYGNYLAFYRIVGATVFIDRVLYARRDYLRLLGAAKDDSQ